MKITEATFEGSFPSIEKCPAPALPEYAFIGRSNVGKSSLINMMTGRKGLAKTSSTPGKTQLINFFKVNGEWIMVDLPGYGFAKVSKDKREQFVTMIRHYLTQRKSLMTVFILVDLRIEPQKSDLEFIRQTGESNIPLAIVFTKTDKLSSRQLHNNLKRYLATLGETWDPLPDYYITSAITKKGREEMLEFISETNNLY